MDPSLATYIHDLDPFLIQFTESFGIRWYGLAYVAGFIAAFFLIRWFVRIGVSELRESQVADFITVSAIFGVMIGGRLGFMLLYEFGDFVRNPAIIFNLMGGGMASHGGIAGLVIASWIYARVTRKSWTGLGDNLVTVAPVGIFFGRLANFVNGELFGRPTDSALAMKFPDELNLTENTATGLEWKFPLSQLRDLVERGREAAPDLAGKVDSMVSHALASGYDAHHGVVKLIVEESNQNPAFRTMVGEILTPRHPSQLYEAMVEGLLLFAILLAVRLKWKNLYHGVLTGLFFILYALGRIAVENFREPDATHILGMTRGQFYSLFMIVVGAAFLVYAFVARRRTQLAEDIPASKGRTKAAKSESSTT